MSLSQVSFAAFAQRLVCPPPPASANGSVLSLAAPAEPGVGVDTLRFLSMTRCPCCGEALSYTSFEAYCGYADCLWNNGAEEA